MSPTGRNHPLADRIWDVRVGSFVLPPDLAGRLAGARFVLLGERHDNAEHHALQARLLRGMIAAGRRPAVGFEMLSTDDATAIARYLSGSPKDASGLGEAVSWKRSGWPDWRLYEPIAQAALDAGLPIVATNLSRVATDAIRRNGLAGLSASLARRLGLEEPLGPETRDAIRRELEESHCGTVEGATLERMVDIQWARDARMAEALVREGQRDGAVLIAGAGHVRTDRGVPFHLQRRAPGATTVSVAFLEVDATVDAPAGYAARFEGALPFDYVWFTPRVDTDDPCARLRAHLLD
ncbi:MAG: hypothetical protein AUH77_04430 [Candidatus Rokubacteria bacterium 13_1_40CM_4_69_39]|nr:MAG: hypothetical protein AUH09_07715 [Candidatus Rokubacteria bacterium 13_2_20CM_70_12]OLC57467.1 MAG: hypothetical protein AUH77_04430 [Candidatus Rokubacteria bacterium 13_1_40CM_4_69_39]OLC92818.1 MAG: hypothetical protein AUJ05_07875 [Candidatus Rokubacteria bacterium 13_1_40CM_3_69_38]OLE48460.1 MAG: hypothetical protein AUG01_07725 [Candidatus Rokubacteria bacterium 13_1_20CM_2_69_58]PYM51079.1 MAG: hypothetical protein DME14_03945 [Candidatus Rokubacteria bacterium]